MKERVTSHPHEQNIVKLLSQLYVTTHFITMFHFFFLWRWGTILKMIKVTVTEIVCQVVSAEEQDTKNVSLCTDCTVMNSCTKREM